MAVATQVVPVVASCSKRAEAVDVIDVGGEPMASGLRAVGVLGEVGVACASPLRVVPALGGGTSGTVGVGGASGASSCGDDRWT